MLAKYKEGKYQFFVHGGNNVYLDIITCENKIVIQSIIQSYVLHWCHTYLLHQGMDRLDAIIFQHLYWTGIRYSAKKDVTNCDTSQLTKSRNKKYGKLSSKKAEWITRKKLWVDLICSYVIRRKGQEGNLNLKAFAVIYPGTWWFKIL